MDLKEFKVEFDKFSEKNWEKYIGDQETNILSRILAYTYFASAKRLRPWIIYSMGETLNIEKDLLLSLGMAIEILHTASLIHDDLPAIDNGTMRRGKKTAHLNFGEDLAILAGDLGFILPFQIITTLNIKDPLKNLILTELSSTMKDLIIGETLDVQFEKYFQKEQINKKDILNMYSKKTSSLFKFCFQIAYLIKFGKKNEKLIEAGEKFGISFQILDDIKDVLGDMKTLGKDTKKDVNKRTYLDYEKIDNARKFAYILFEDSLKILESFGFNTFSKKLLEIWELINKK